VVELLACPEDVPTLENFAYGDTPTRRSLRALCAEMLQTAGASDEIVVGLMDLADRHDMRMLVTRTALTYLELLGALRQGTPFYAGYRLRPKMPLDEIVARFRGEHARFVEALFRHAKRARIWYSIDPERVATLMNEPRSRIVRAIEVLEERECAEVSASELRHRFTRTQSDADVDGLTDELWRRFSRREAQEVARLGQVLSLITHDGCLSNALAAHFGEQRAQACGHCSHCLSGRAAALPPRAPQPPLPAGLDLAELSEVRAAHRDSLVEPRQVARLLCGLASPALTRAKLSRHPLFGALGDRPFAEVLAWCERSQEMPPSPSA
jgi:ATP-dependent DNA helicase RecQ